MTKDMMIKALSEFMASKGVDSMTLVEYKGYGSDVPVKDYLLKRYFGSWARVMSVVKARYPVSVAPAPAPKVEKKVAKKEVKDVKQK
tara:strand:+ start:502 stop:762 length:261 start_codon:yes stop_codon:yes gene_type:complete